MELATLSWAPRTGWSAPVPAQMDGPGTVVILFGAADPGAMADPIAALRSSLPQSRMIGCSTAGEIHGSEVTDDSLTVAIVRFARSTQAIVAEPVASSAESCDVGERLAARLAGPDLRAVFVLSDGLAVNGSELVRGLASKLPPEVVISGGLAGDGTRFGRTWVLVDGVPTPGHVAALGLYGAVRVATGSRGGWTEFGPQRRITRAVANKLFAIDGQPALALYKEYLGELAAGLPATALLFPLSLRVDRATREPLVRTVLAVDEADQSITFAGDVPVGSFVRLMRSSLDGLVEGARSAGEQALEGWDPVGPMLSIAISCVGRRLVLKQRVEDETEAALEAMRQGGRQIGFYSYGEISPTGFSTCDLHNQTMTLTMVSEDA